VTADQPDEEDTVNDTDPNINRKEHRMQFRQGDVLIAKTDRIPDGLTEVPRDNGRVILAYGEATGHAHAVVGDAELLGADIAEMDRRFLRVLGEGAEVVHDEHDPIALPPGDYEVIGQREYQPEAPVRVAD
jgi:hypothetical protein